MIRKIGIPTSAAALQGRFCVFGGVLALLLSPACCWSWEAPVAVDLNTSGTIRFDTELSLAHISGSQWGLLWTANGTTGTEFGVQFSRTMDGGQTWSTPADVSQTMDLPEGEFGDAPCLASDHSGNLIAVWDANPLQGTSIDSSRDVHYARSANGGASWSAPGFINMDYGDATARSFRPDLATDGAGKWIAVWEAYRQRGVYQVIASAHSNDAGQSWSAIQDLDTPTTASLLRSPRVATDGSGTWLVAWESESTTDTDILYVRSTDHGQTWSPSSYLNSNAVADNTRRGYYDGQVRLASAGGGVWVAVWTTTYDAGTTVPVADQIVCARSVDGGANWSSPFSLSASASGQFARYHPDIVWDGTDFTVIWTGAAGMEATVSHNLGQSWSAPVAVAGNSAYPGGGRSAPRLASNGSIRMAGWIHQPESASGADIIAARDSGFAGVADYSLY